MVDTSPLHDVGPPFSIIHSVPLEEFHLLKEGLTKKIMQRLFEQSSTVHSRAIFSLWSEVMIRTPVFSEMSRRSGKLTTGQMKGSEFGLILYTGFTALLDILKDFAGYW